MLFSAEYLYLPHPMLSKRQQASYAKEQLEQELRKLNEQKDKLENGSQTTPKRLRWNYAVNRVYVVCVLNYIMDRKYPDKYRWDVIRMDRELKIPFSDTLTEVYLEMPKFSLKLSECDTLYKKFLYVLNNIDILERLPKELNDQIFQKLKSIVEIERMTLDERLAYELSLSTERDLCACMETKYEEGMEKGMEKGIEKGKAEEQRLIAANFKKQGVNIETIAQCTGLSVEEINEL